MLVGKYNLKELTEFSKKLLKEKQELENDLIRKGLKSSVVSEIDTKPYLDLHNFLIDLSFNGVSVLKKITYE